MIAIIEEMVLTIENGGKSHKENVEYAESIIGIIRGADSGAESLNSGLDNGGAESGDNSQTISIPPQRLCSTGNIPRIEDAFVKEERIGED